MNKKLRSKPAKELYDFDSLLNYLKESKRHNWPIEWDFISSSYDLPDWYIIEHINELHWDRLTYYQYWTEDRIRMFKNYIVWQCLEIPDVSINFIREFQDYLDLKHRRLRKDLKNEFNRHLRDNEQWWY